MGKMQYYTVKDYVELLEKRGMLLENRVEGEEDHVIRNLTYNSKEAGADTMFICKGAAFKPQYLLDAAEKGAFVYVSERGGRSAPCPASWCPTCAR
mgnify:CR=1 FL=1